MDIKQVMLGRIKRIKQMADQSETCLLIENSIQYELGVIKKEVKFLELDLKALEGKDE